jgi:peptidoglycan/LPS O-acetylase OafA/YrhL
MGGAFPIDSGVVNRGEQRARIAYLDGIRALAIVAVLGVHWAYPYTGIGRGGYVGVDIFFVLSGFIITKILWASRGQRTYKEFISGRVRRLYPALLGVVIIVTPLAILTGATTAGQSLLGAALSVLQVNSLVRGLDLASADPFGVTWSLSAEWIFYLLWPAVVLFAVRASRQRLAVLAGIAALSLYGISLLTTTSFFYYGPTSRGSQLLVGAAIALVVHGRGEERVGRARYIATVGAPLAIAFIAAWTLIGPPEHSDLYRFVGFPLVTVAAAFLVLSGEASSHAPAVRLLSVAPAATLGRSSYSLYLWHTAPLVLLDKDAIPLPPVVLAGIAVAVAVLMTWLSYTFLEKPFMRTRTPAIVERSSGEPSPRR